MVERRDFLSCCDEAQRQCLLIDKQGWDVWNDAFFVVGIQGIGPPLYFEQVRRIRPTESIVRWKHVVTVSLLACPTRDVFFPEFNPCLPPLCPAYASTSCEARPAAWSFHLPACMRSRRFCVSCPWHALRDAGTKAAAASKKLFVLGSCVELLLPPSPYCLHAQGSFLMSWAAETMQEIASGRSSAFAGSSGAGVPEAALGHGRSW